MCVCVCVCWFRCNLSLCCDLPSLALHTHTHTFINVEIFSNFINFTVTSDHFNASLMNKSINLFKKYTP